MANADTEQSGAEAPEKRKSGTAGLFTGLGLAVALGGGGFFAVWSGLVLNPEDPAPPEAELAALPALSFVPLDPLVVSLAPEAASDHLRFEAQLEVDGAHRDDVTLLIPRIVDVLNSYLRAVDPADLEDPGALTRLRAQMLRRVQIVAGEGRVRDLLIMEFVLS